jgi:hypothetical protein
VTQVKPVGHSVLPFGQDMEAPQRTSPKHLSCPGVSATPKQKHVSPAPHLTGLPQPEKGGPSHATAPWHAPSTHSCPSGQRLKQRPQCLSFVCKDQAFLTVPHPPKPGHIAQKVNARGSAYATCYALQPFAARRCKGRGFGVVYC